MRASRGGCLGDSPLLLPCRTIGLRYPCRPTHAPQEPDTASSARKPIARRGSSGRSPASAGAALQHCCCCCDRRPLRQCHLRCCQPVPAAWPTRSARSRRRSAPAAGQCVVVQGVSQLLQVSVCSSAGVSYLLLVVCAASSSGERLGCSLLESSGVAFSSRRVLPSRVVGCCLLESSGVAFSRRSNRTALQPTPTFPRHSECTIN
jgi:hypothetical protein